jgi:hypothetical protein
VYVKKQVEVAQSKFENESFVIKKLLNNSARWLLNIFGKSSIHFLKVHINFEDYELASESSETIAGIFCSLDMTNLIELLQSLPKETNSEIVFNQCISRIHCAVEAMGGDIFSKEVGKYMFSWNLNERTLLRSKAATEGEYEELKSQFNTSRAELSLSSVLAAWLEVKVFLRDYLFIKHDMQNSNIRGLVTFALHRGIGLKFPTGGLQKVDMALLSRDISTTMGLNKLNRHYGLEIIVTDPVYSLLSPSVRDLNADQRVPVRDR